MLTKTTYRWYFLVLVIALLMLLMLNISIGSVRIPFDDIFAALTGQEVSKRSWEVIIWNYRLPKALTALMVGSGLAVSGLLMQTLFRNPLAGPFVLGISSGASLGVALFILGSGLFGGLFSTHIFQNSSLAMAASAGSFLVLSGVILAANRVRNTMSILIIGLMFGSLTSSIISILTYFSEATEIQQYQFWSFGSLGNLSWKELGVFFGIYSLAMIGTFSVIKPLNSFLLGEYYAKSLGINIKKSRNIILLITSLLTGVITAFAGPIAFVGLAVPHIAKLLFTSSNHKVLLPAVSILGALVLLICDTIAQLPNSAFVLPINAITSLFGAPVVIWLLLRKKKMYV
ncbi:Iron ABC transporter [Tenacibaculum litopenaei]